MAKENIIPAGYENHRYGGYMDDDDYDEEDDLNSVVYPNMPPLKPGKLSDPPSEENVVDPVKLNEQINDEADKCEEEKSFIMDLNEKLAIPDEEKEKEPVEATPIDWTETNLEENPWADQNGDYEDGEINSQSSEDEAFVCRSPTPMEKLTNELWNVVSKHKFAEFKKLMETNNLTMNTSLSQDRTPFSMICGWGNSEMLEYALSCKADVKEIFPTGLTPLLLVCQPRYDENSDDSVVCAQHLLNSGANKEARDEKGRTPLLLACDKGNSRLVRLLLDFNCDVNACDTDGQTPLHYVAKNLVPESLELAKIMVEKGANINCSDKNSQSPIDLAKLHNRPVYNYLRQELETENIWDASNGIKKRQQYSFCTELEEFLANLDLADYTSFFEAKRITLPDLLLFSPEDFKRSGLEYGVQLRLMEAISRRPGYKSHDLPLLTRKSKISCPTAIRMLKTVNKHLMFIDTDIRYLRNRLRDDPSMLEREDTLGNKEDLIIQTENASHYCTVLRQILGDIDQRLKKGDDNDSNNTEDGQSKSLFDQTFLLKVGGCVAIGSLVLTLVYRSSFIRILPNF